MKKISVLAVIAVFVMMPLVSFAKTVISDSNLGTVFAQSGAVTIIFSDLAVKSRNLETVSTNLIDIWGLDIVDHKRDTTGDAYIGMADGFITGGVVKRSGTMTLEVVLNDPTTPWSQSTLYLDIPSQTIDASSLGINATIKLGTDPTLAGTQSLGQTYMTGLKYTMTTDDPLHRPWTMKITTYNTP